MVGDLSWTGWSSIPKVDIVRTTAALAPGNPAGSIAQTLETQFRDTWRVAFGGIYQYSGNLDLKFGIAYDQTPVKSAELRLVSLPDNDRVWFSAGAQWKFSKDAKLDLGAAYLYVRDTDIDNNQSAAPSFRGRVTGTYDSNVWILGAQYSRSF
jgi:long-chain fatty acid transport protein